MTAGLVTLVLGLPSFGARSGPPRVAVAVAVAACGACVLLALGDVIGLLPPHQPGALVAGVAPGWAALTVG
ncbi:hypothetical protein [Pseudonocardia sp. NPDC046786]|uniref:hypothetical protein n=1 Tax=Pseudonocardia sp. NPDC046786 TaxID=3155471 RepID=UPI0033DF8204